MPCYKPRLLTVKGKEIFVPCGQCIGCKLSYSRQWATRCCHEAEMHEKNCFLTLTYATKYMPTVMEYDKPGTIATLNKQHPVKFLRRLRDRVGKIRYYGCGEYGTKLDRPHYHICIFGWKPDPEDLEPWEKSQQGYPQWMSKTINELWEYGISTVSEFTWETAAYCARYCLKKITGKNADDYYNGKQPEYSMMSRRPGIGHEFFEKYTADIYNYDTCVIRDNVKMRPPRYYDKKYEEQKEIELICDGTFDIQENEMEVIKSKRIDKAEKKFAGWHRLRQKEQFTIHKHSKSKRQFEEFKNENADIFN